MKPKRTMYLEKILRLMAIIILKRHRPFVIGITGSVGKSSAKDATYLVLKNNFKVRKSIGNYNNEIGIPLTVIGAKSGGKNPLKWIFIFLKWLFLVISPVGYPKILILEMATDHPGDMKYLTGFIPVKIAIVTDISLSHLKFFKNVKQISKEKTALAKSIPQDGLAILNLDNHWISDFSKKFDKHFIGFGIDSPAEIRASDIKIIYKNSKLNGLSFKLNFKGKTIPFRLPNIIGKHQVYAVLPAIAVANFFKINLIEAIKRLNNFQSPKGRMNLLRGINNSLIIDDSYNASPLSVNMALKSVSEIKANRKAVVLGDMLELGNRSKMEHQNIISGILENDEIKILILVGERMKDAFQVVSDNKTFSKRVLIFDNSEEAINNILKEIKIFKNDLILVKGSRAMKMEKIIDKLIL